MNALPVLGKERLVSIDIIRGFALFGIFLVNMPAFHSAYFLKSLYGIETDYTGTDYWVDLFFTLFVDMKFFTIFSFLFGLGFYIFMSRAEQKGLKMNRLFSRRILGLLIIGGLHFVFIWFGDILHTYAITGILLLLFYKRKIKTLIVWATVLLFITNLLFGLMMLLPNGIIAEMNESSKQTYEENIDEYVGIYENAGYLEWVSYRFHNEVLTILTNLVFNMLPVLAMFLFGLAAGKAEIFKPDMNHGGFIRKVRNIALFISIPLVIFLALYKLDIVDAGIKSDSMIQLFTSLSGVSLCFFYIFALASLLRSEVWLIRLRPLGYVGQMALTNYLSQSIVCVILFVGFGFYGDVSLTVGTLICLVIFTLQILFSYVWLKKFQFGPFEWIWRTITYGKIQSLKKKDKSVGSITQ
ncbi:DUF418 domain-containing protein [Bacillus salitolerans]|uniref:DUF418 domain-containing protein n=1 Tax=Bacillus salitolerans TaxID=1437434 RepID=A0ABW4LSF6_9BACI